MLKNNNNNLICCLSYYGKTYILRLIRAKRNLVHESLEVKRSLESIASMYQHAYKFLKSAEVKHIKTILKYQIEKLTPRVSLATLSRTKS